MARMMGLTHRDLKTAIGNKYVPKLKGKHENNEGSNEEKSQQEKDIYNEEPNGKSGAEKYRRGNMEHHDRTTGAQLIFDQHSK